MANQEQKANHHKYSVQSIADMRLRNYVLVKKKYRNADAISKAGIVLYQSKYTTNQFLGNVIDRVFEVVKNPYKLIPKGWVTDIETQPGDEVYIKEMEAANCPIIETPDETYYLLNYDALRVIRRGDEIIPVNGFVLMRDVKKTTKVGSYSKTEVDWPYGEVAHVGKKLKGIVRKTGDGKKKFVDTDCNIDLEKGDIVYIGAYKGKTDIDKRYLEYSIYSHLDEPYWAIQRRFIDAIIN
jgi:co-chaperonin GroES (HSP10)